MKGLHKKEIFLHPGDYYFSEQNELVGTILGSCIAIIFWHPVRRWGGMCHFVLPDYNDGPKPEKKGRYAEGAIELFQESIRKRKFPLSDYQVKVFGGANTVAELAGKEKKSVGQRNTEKAIELLVGIGANIMVADVGESGHRRILFDIDTGDVWVKRHSKTPLARTPTVSSNAVTV